MLILGRYFAGSFKSQGFLHSCFNIYMKLLDEIICQYGVRYHDYDTQLPIPAHGELNDSTTTVSWCLEAVEVWMGSNN